MEYVEWSKSRFKLILFLEVLENYPISVMEDVMPFIQFYIKYCAVRRQDYPSEAIKYEEMMKKMSTLKNSLFIMNHFKTGYKNKIEKSNSLTGCQNYDSLVTKSSLAPIGTSWDQPGPQLPAADATASVEVAELAAAAKTSVSVEKKGPRVEPKHALEVADMSAKVLISLVVFFVSVAVQASSEEAAIIAGAIAVAATLALSFSALIRVHINFENEEQLRNQACKRKGGDGTGCYGCAAAQPIFC